MARPRQRKKIQNPLTKVTRKQKNPNKISFSRVHPLVQKHWDPKLTLMQNYSRLGLMSSLKGKAGGIGNEFYVKEEETVVGKRRQYREQWDVEDILVVDPKLAETAVQCGAVTVMNEQGQEEEYLHSLNQSENPLDQENKDNQEEEEFLPENKVKIDPKLVTLGRRPGHLKDSTIQVSMSDLRTDFLKALEEEAAKQVKVVREVSEHEIKILIELIKKHQLNLNAMAQDRKLNKFQLSAGQLKRKLKNLSVYFGMDLEI